MLLANALEDGRRRSMLSRFGVHGRLEQLVGYAAHGGDHYDNMTFLRRGPDNLHHTGDARCVAHRGSTKFHDPDWLLEIATDISGHVSWHVPGHIPWPIFGNKVMLEMVPGLKAGANGAICDRSLHRRGKPTVERA